MSKISSKRSWKSLTFLLLQYQKLKISFFLRWKGKKRAEPQSSWNKNKLQQCKKFKAQYLGFIHKTLGFLKGLSHLLGFILSSLPSRSLLARVCCGWCFWWLSHGTNIFKIARVHYCNLALFSNSIAALAKLSCSPWHFHIFKTNITWVTFILQRLEASKRHNLAYKSIEVQI